MKGPYVIKNSKGDIIYQGYDQWDTNEEARKEITEICETFKKLFKNEYSISSTR